MLKRLILINALVFVLLISPVYASNLYDLSGKTVLENQDTLTLTEGWQYSNKRWHFLSSDGYLKNQWCADANGNDVGYLDANGDLTTLDTTRLETAGPGCTLNQALTNGIDKVNLNMNIMCDYDENELALLSHIVNDFRIEEIEKDSGGYLKQECFIVLTASDFGLTAKEFTQSEVLPMLNKLQEDVIKDTKGKLIMDTKFESTMPMGYSTYVTLTLDKRILTRVTSVLTLRQYLNNCLVSDLHITNETTQKEAADKIYDYIVANFTYSEECKYSDLLTCWISKKGLCWDFATFYKYMCNMCGIECSVVSYFPSNTEDVIGHSWNKLLIDGIEYWTDCTYGLDSYKNNEDFNKYKFMSFVDLAQSHSDLVFAM